MSDAIRDQNFIPAALGVSNINSSVTLPFKIDSITGRLLIDSATGGTVTSITQGTGILLSPSPITTTGSVSLATNIAPIATLGSALQSIRVNAGATALEYYTPTAGTVTSVAGTSNRITSTGGATPIIDISASYVGQASITTVGTLSSGAVPLSLVTGLGANVATALAIAVGSAGAFVTFNGALGTPSSGTLSSCTGLPISTGVSGLGSNVATFLATPSSANLASAVTDETGSGSLVFATSPTLAGKPVINNFDNTGATYAPSSGSQTVALDCASNNMHIVTGNNSGTAITFTIANATNNQPFIVSILQGSGTLSTIAGWFATVRWAGGVTPTFTATLNKRDTFGFIRTGSNTYDGFIVGQNC